MTDNPYHIPVLLNAAIDGLAIKPNGIYVDLTFGGGGHSKAILEKLGPEGRLLGFDQDPDAHKNALKDDRFTLVPSNFRFLKNYLRLYKALPVDGILADLGVSSHQFDTGERGFSIRFDGPLDMRMNPSAQPDAASLLNAVEQDELQRILKVYGELKQAGRVARTLVEYRDKTPFKTVEQLIEAILPYTPAFKGHQFQAKVFQALRIAVNSELEALEEMLLQTIDVLEPGGRLVVMSYHSLEDRMVKNFMKRGDFEGKEEKDFFGNSLKPFKTVVSKAIVPNEEEIKINNRARSARLRIAERLA